MAQIDSQLSTGLSGLDRVLRGLIPGDNIVWQLGSIDDYRPFISPYQKAAEKLGQPLVYFRFAKHPPLLSEDSGARICELDPAEGFEPFLAGVHKAIEETGRGGYYLFDCLSDLAADWYSDQMLGNFFMLTCPYLYDMEAIAYFSLLRDTHAFQATNSIADTAQVLIDVYNHSSKLYIHPWKVQARYSPTMHMLHARDGDEFHPIMESTTISEVLTSSNRGWLGNPAVQAGAWQRTFVQAEEMLAHGGEGSLPEQAGPYVERIMRMAISRDERVLKLCNKYFSLKDVVDTGRRMIGTGLIGGKSVGMLLARAILRKDKPRLAARLEPHDSFYVGSDVFYTFLVRNGIWWVRERQKDPSRFLDGSERARQRILTGTFPDYIQKQFEDMLDYFGQSPIIVRSSSLLEDNFGNAFAGKYESVFCANQGPRHRRLDDFMSAVRTIYASCMSEKALAYRASRGLLEMDEQMALLIQRVSGAMYGDNLYYPQMAGVGFSFNPYVWSDQIDPEAGMMRLVFGLGTRAVDRSDDDYTRLVALNAPHRRVETDIEEVRRYSQRKVDVIDLEANQLYSADFASVAAASKTLPLKMFASKDPSLLRHASDSKARKAFPWVLTFDGVFSDTTFVQDMREMLAKLQQAYDYPVDVEFTANFLPDGSYRINIVQCRPLQVKEGGQVVDPPEDLADDDVVVRSRGAVLGQNRHTPVDRIVYVVPHAYGQLPIARRHAVARLIGRVMHAESSDEKTIMLLGPGRWCTTTPSLGVPARFSDISTASIICEIVAMRDDLIPDVSLGTHFFSDMVEMDIMYFTLYPDRTGNVLKEEIFTDAKNILPTLVKDGADWADIVKVIDTKDLPGGAAFRLNANSLKQRVVGYLER